MKETTNKYLIAALLLGLAFHGTSIFCFLQIIMQTVGLSPGIMNGIQGLR